jgi:hypothetical protein
LLFLSHHHLLFFAFFYLRAACRSSPQLAAFAFLSNRSLPHFPSNCSLGQLAAFCFFYLTAVYRSLGHFPFFTHSLYLLFYLTTAYRFSLFYLTPV